MQCEDGTGKMPNPWGEEEEESESLYTSAVTSHAEVKVVMQQFVYRRTVHFCMIRHIEVKGVMQEFVCTETEGLYTSAMTRHVEVNRAKQEFVYKESAGFFHFCSDQACRNEVMQQSVYRQPERLYTSAQPGT
jgi:hypothetical protein